jgi:hypothetical protein
MESAALMVVKLDLILDVERVMMMVVQMAMSALR